ncbi:MAG: hypothetical protein HFJ44_00980 [Clostridia bacterium]|jgi:hypothetical protein|nr:hypothetical protein [Clostridia bacterium]
MKKFRSFVALCLAMVMAFSFSAVAFAAEPEVDAFADVVLAEDETVAYQDDEVMIVESPAAANGISPLSNCYNGQWVGSSSSGSFVVNSDNSGTVGITVSTEATSSSDWAYITIVKPNGNAFKNDIGFYGSQSKEYKMYFASKGNYTIRYQVYTTGGLRINCWIY